MQAAVAWTSQRVRTRSLGNVADPCATLDQWYSQGSCRRIHVPLLCLWRGVREHV